MRKAIFFLCYFVVHANVLLCQHDYSFTGDINNDGMDELVLVNTSGENGAIRSLNLTNADNLSWIEHGDFGGWMDSNDKMFFGDVNGDNKDDLVLVNTSYNSGAIRAIDIITGSTLSWINHGSFEGWMDSTDRMFLGDVNNDGKKDLVLVNTSNSFGAIRVIDITTGNDIAWINHGDFLGWMDNEDKMFLEDINDDGSEDLVFVNTSYNSGAIRAINITSGDNLVWIEHGSFGSWMDSNDKVFISDVNGDDRKDLLLINTNYIGGAIKAINLANGEELTEIPHGTLYGWMDYCDRMFCEDINGDNRDDLILINTAYNSGAIRVIDILSNTSIAWINHGDFFGWMDSDDRILLCNAKGNDEKQILMLNAEANSTSVRVFDMLTNTNYLSPSSSSISPDLSYWLDGKQDELFCSGDNPPNGLSNQYVYLLDGVFYSYGSPYFPKVLNYQVDICTDDYSNLWVAPHHSFESNNLSNCTNQSEAFSEMCNDMQIIADMGFNTVRIVGLGLYAKKNSEDSNMYFSGKIHPYTTAIDNFESVYSGLFVNKHLYLAQIVLEAAKSAGLKVILLSGGSYCHRDNISALYSDYLANISFYFRDNSTLMAYDLYNEPANDFDVLYDKSILCQRVNDWYNSIKTNSENHLVTIGLFGYSDVLYWDPAIMSVDFLSFHIYPHKTSVYTNVNSELKWISENISKPWIIGETGYSAFEVPTDYCSYTLLFDKYGLGSELQQKEYAEYSFNLTRYCGGKGFSWWSFHDVYHTKDTLPSPYNDESYMGLVTRCQVIKPAAEVFEKDGFDIPCYECPTTSVTDYYNYRNTKYYTYGYIKDPSGSIVKDAVVRGRDENGNLITTLTKANGYFKICSDVKLDYIEYSSVGTTRDIYEPNILFSGYVGNLVIPDYINTSCNCSGNILLDDLKPDLTLEKQEGELAGLSSELIVFPNPANSSLFIVSQKIKIYDIQMLDLNGNVVKYLKNPDSVSNTICLDDISTGLYFLRLRSDSGIITKKILVSK